VRFENAIAESSWTIPTVASIFTGVYPAVHRTTNYESVLPSELLTMAEAFQAAGYTTGARISNILVNERHGYLQGFDDGRVVMNLYKNLFFERLLAQARITAHYDFAPPTRSPRRPSPGCAATGAASFSMSTTTTRTSLLAGALRHEVIDPAMAKGSPRAFVGDTLWNLVSEYKIGTRKRPEEIAYARAAYDGEVLYTDRQIGRLLKYLRATGLDKNTVVVFVADHGEQFYEHGERLHSKTLYNEEIHVPLIIRAPGHAPRVVQRRVRSLDLFPTLAELADLPARLEGKPEAGLLARQSMGVSLVPLLAGGDLPAAYRDEAFASVDIDDVVKEATFQGPWKLIQNKKRGDSLPRPPLELYQIEKDPRERHDAADADRATRDRMVGGGRPTRRGPARCAGGAPRLAPRRRRSSALGYINR
jgi:arylsulfatase A-like enzyme